MCQDGWVDSAWEVFLFKGVFNHRLKCPHLNSWEKDLQLNIFNFWHFVSCYQTHLQCCLMYYTHYSGLVESVCSILNCQGFQCFVYFVQLKIFESVSFMGKMCSPDQDSNVAPLDYHAYQMSYWGCLIVELLHAIPLNDRHCATLRPVSVIDCSSQDEHPCQCFAQAVPKVICPREANKCSSLEKNVQPRWRFKPQSLTVLRLYQGCLIGKLLQQCIKK